MMRSIGIGIIGGGYMGKAHAVAYNAVASVFNTALKPRLEMVCARTRESAEHYQQAYGFNSATDDWRELVSNPSVEAVIIASPQATHKEIALAAFEANKHVFCEKPLGASLEDATIMTKAATTSGLVHMIGFNYIRTPATQFIRQLVQQKAIGDLVWFRGEHTEDFYADPELPANWRAENRASGTMGDLAPHMINAALAICGPVRQVMADIETVHKQRPGGQVKNDDQAHCMVRFDNGCMGHLLFSRVSHGRKMGYCYEITGTKGAIRFDQEDQNCFWLYKAEGDEATRGFTKILTGPSHPDYLAFCQGAGHGTGYQDQIIIEARDFLNAVEAGTPLWPDFSDGLAVSRIIDACFSSAETKSWVSISQN